MGGAWTESCGGESCWGESCVRVWCAVELRESVVGEMW